MQLHLEAELHGGSDRMRRCAMSTAGARSIPFSVRQREDFVMAQMDARLIVQVIINIVDNAIKYTPPGSDIDHRPLPKQRWNGRGEHCR